jgi:hypothetical protein
MNNHNNFISSSITEILRDVVIASAGIGSGIETYPLCDYIMQSVFLKMTGFQEQKMKCICWEMATNDYEYRRVLLNDEDKLGECSSYDAKNKIYKQLIQLIKKHNTIFNVSNDIDKNNILTSTKSDISDNFRNTNLLIWAQKDFNEYENIISGINVDWFANDSNILFKDKKDKKPEKLQLIYDFLYKHRNRCAHNLLSYQQNLPMLKTLTDENYKYENYFVRFAILILIDKIFIELYTKYLNAFEENRL